METTGMRKIGWLAALALGGCTGGGAAEPVTIDTDEAVFFACKPEAGAPRQRLAVLEITMSAEEVASAKADLKDAEDEPPTDPDTTTLEKNVRFATYDGEDGAEGHCFRRNEGGKYSCHSFDGGLKLDWQGEVPAGKTPSGEATVLVRERWLFGTKQYQATCTHKD